MSNVTGKYELGVIMAPSIAAKLSQLFDEHRKPDGRPFTNTDIIRALGRGGHARISPSYLSELRTGKKGNPSIWTVKALADFFGEPLDYFVRDRSVPTEPPKTLPAAATLSEQIDPLRDEAARRIVARALALSASDLAIVSGLLDRLANRR
jgi:transcriptional regulator with XRE-family HTH domain